MVRSLGLWRACCGVTTRSGLPDMKKLKLFVWTHFSPDYTSGLAFAIAEDVEQAKKKVRKAYHCNPRDWGTLTVRPLTKRCAFAVGGGG